MSLVIKKPITANTVVTFRIVTGEMVIGRFVESSATTLTVRHPLVANAVQNEQGVAIMFSPFCYTVEAESTYTMQKTALLFDAIPALDALVKSYTTQTSALVGM